MNNRQIKKLDDLINKYESLLSSGTEEEKKAKEKGNIVCEQIYRIQNTEYKEFIEQLKEIKYSGDAY